MAIRKSLDLGKKKEVSNSESEGAPLMSLKDIIAKGYNYDPNVEVPVPTGVLSELISIANVYLDDNTEQVMQRIPKIEEGQVTGFTTSISIMMKGAAPHVDEFLSKTIEPLAVQHFYDGYFVNSSTDGACKSDISSDEVEPYVEQRCSEDECRGENKCKSTDQCQCKKEVAEVE